MQFTLNFFMDDAVTRRGYIDVISEMIRQAVTISKIS
jgi:hypothetical protein